MIQSNSINDNYKMFSEKYVGRNFGWHRPNYKMLLGKFMLAFPIFGYFSTSGAYVFVVHILNCFQNQIKLFSVFCSCKKRPCIQFCSCRPDDLFLVLIKILCTTPPPLSEPRFKWRFLQQPRHILLDVSRLQHHGGCNQQIREENRNLKPRSLGCSEQWYLGETAVAPPWGRG